MKYLQHRKVKVIVTGDANEVSSFLSHLSSFPQVSISQVSMGKKCTFFVETRQMNLVRKAKKMADVRIHFERVVPKTSVIIPLLMTLLLFGSIPYLSTYFLLSIEVSGPDHLLSAAEETLENVGIQTPLFKKNRAEDRFIRQKLMTEVPDIAWVLLEENGSVFHVTLIPAPTPVKPIELPSAPAFVAKEDAVVERVYLVSGERRVHRKDVVKKGQLLAEGMQGMQAQGEIRGIYWKELTFFIQLNDKQKFDMKNSHLQAILEKFIDSEESGIQIMDVKILHVQNDNGKVEGKVLLKLEGNIAKPTYLKETVNDN